MENITSIDVFKPTFIAGVVKSFKADPAKFKGSVFCPIRATLEEKIVIDVKNYYDGLIPAVALGAESPVVLKQTRGVMTYLPAYFRGKKIITEGSIELLRRLGSNNQKETRQELMAGWLGDLDRQVELRIEHARWQTLVYGEYSFTVDGKTITVDYNVGAKYYPVLTGTDKWSDLANSDPMNDLLNWGMLYRGSPASLGSVWINLKTLTYLAQNAKIRAYIKQSFGSDRRVANQQLITEVFRAEIPGFTDIQVYDEGYNAHSFVSSSASSGQKDITVEDASFFTSGDIITLKSADEKTQEDATIDSISGNVITILVNLTSTYAVGTNLTVFKPFIPDGKVILKGKIPVGEMDMSFITTPSAYNGGLLNPKPGKFAKTIITDGDPPKVELVSGIYGLPVMRKDTNVVATVS